MSDAKGRQHYKHLKSGKYVRQFERTAKNKEKRLLKKGIKPNELIAFLHFDF